MRIYFRAYGAVPFLCAQNPRKLFNKKSVKIRGAEGKLISGDPLGCPDLGSGRPDLGKSEKSVGFFPFLKFPSGKAETLCNLEYGSSHPENLSFYKKHLCGIIL